MGLLQVPTSGSLRSERVTVWNVFSTEPARLVLSEFSLPSQECATILCSLNIMSLRSFTSSSPEPNNIHGVGDHPFAVQSLSRVRLFATPWTAARQASLSVTNSQSLLKLMSVESVMPSTHLVLCCPLLLLPSVFPSIRVFFSELALSIRWPKHWSLNFSITPSDEYLGPSLRTALFVSRLEQDYMLNTVEVWAGSGEAWVWISPQTSSRMVLMKALQKWDWSQPSQEVFAFWEGKRLYLVGVNWGPTPSLYQFFCLPSPSSFLLPLPGLPCSSR